MGDNFHRLSCIICVESWGASTPKPHSMPPKYPKGLSPKHNKKVEDSEVKAVFEVIGMTCSASIEKAIKRLPGIIETSVDVLNNKALVLYYSSFVTEDRICETIEDVGFQATILTKEDKTDQSLQVCRVRIIGMTCTSCSFTVESALQSLHGIQTAQVTLATEEAEVYYDPAIINYNDILQNIEDTGFDATLISLGEDLSKIDIQIDGFKTDYSLKTISKSLQALPGVQDVDTYPELKKISISYRANITGPRTFVELIESTGSGQFKAMIYPDQEKGRDSRRQQEIKQYYNYLLWSLVFTIPVFLTSMVFMYIPGLRHILDTKIVKKLTIGEILRWELATPVQFFIGRRFYVGAYKALRHGSANMDVLITFGTNAAYFYSVYIVLRTVNSQDFKGTDFFETSSMLITFILLGKYLEALAKGKTSEAIAKLMDLAPKSATLLTLDGADGNNIVSEVEIDSRLIQKNDVIKIVPGAKLGSDGVVIWGQSMLMRV